MRLHGILKGFGSAPETPGGKCETCRPVKGFGSIPTLGNEAFTLELVADNGNRVRTNVLANEYYLPGVGVTQAQANAAAQTYFRAIGEAQLNRSSVSVVSLPGDDVTVTTPAYQLVKGADTLWRGGKWLHRPLPVFDRWDINYVASTVSPSVQPPEEGVRFGFDPVAALTSTPHCWFDGPPALPTPVNPHRSTSSVLSRWFAWWDANGMRAVLAPTSTENGEFSTQWLASQGAASAASFPTVLPSETPVAFSACWYMYGRVIATAAEVEPGVIALCDGYEPKRKTFTGSSPVMFSPDLIGNPSASFGTCVVYVDPSDRRRLLLRTIREKYTVEHLYATLPVAVGRIVSAAFRGNCLFLYALSAASRRGAVEQLVIRSKQFPPWPNQVEDVSGLSIGLSGGSVGDALVGVLQYDLGVQSTGLSGGELFGSAGYFDTLAYDLGVQSTGLTGGELEDTYVLLTSVQYDVAAQTTGLASGELVETTSNKTTTTPAESVAQSGSLSWGQIIGQKDSRYVIPYFDPYTSSPEFSPWLRCKFYYPNSLGYDQERVFQYAVLPIGVTRPPVVCNFAGHEDCELEPYGEGLAVSFYVDIFSTCRIWVRVCTPTSSNGISASPWNTFAYQLTGDPPVTQLGQVSESWL